MGDKWESLSTTQAQFTEYIDKNISDAKRIIFYKHNGHFGLEFAIMSRYKRSELLNLKELKTKTGKNLFFRIFSIVLAIISFFLNHFKDIDTRTTVSTILSNMENVYLGIDKQLEYLKYLKIKKIPRKNGKIKFFIRIEENEIYSVDDKRCIDLLCKLIKNGNINNTVLLISCEQLSMSYLTQFPSSSNIPLFEFNLKDFKFIAERKNLELTELASQNIELVKKLGLQFYIDNYMYFDVLAEEQEGKTEWFSKIDWIVRQIIEKGEIENNKIYALLEFASFFEYNFSKLDIKYFKDNILKADNLIIAHKLALISKEKSSIYPTPTYGFEIESFKQYFAYKYLNDLEPIPEYIYEYFRNKFPFDYLPALNVLHVDPSFIEHKELQSLIIIAFYFQNYEMKILRQNKFTHYTTKDSTAAKIIHLYTNFKEGYCEAQLKAEVESIIQSLCNNVFDEISTCAGYVIILQYIRENTIQFNENLFSDLMNNFMATLLNINEENSYNRYWKNHFKCQYIALSLEDENAKPQTARKFLLDIEKLEKDENFSVYINNNKLRGFSRIKLLTFSLAFDNAGEILRDLYMTSEESSIIKELARINYSAYLVENEFFHEAHKILSKGRITFLKNINMDTYCSYLNNLYFAQLGGKIIDIDQYILNMSNLVNENINYNDKCIIDNNLSTAFLIQGTYVEKSIEKLKEHINTGNPYNKFLAVHNLLSYYFIKNDINNFNEIYNIIEIPKLLISSKTFFLNKFKWMKQNIGKTRYESFCRSDNVINCYNEPYIISSMERWFE